jgi:hypothetical protein
MGVFQMYLTMVNDSTQNTTISTNVHAHPSTDAGRFMMGHAVFSAAISVATAANDILEEAGRMYHRMSEMERLCTNDVQMFESNEEEEEESENEAAAMDFDQTNDYRYEDIDAGRVHGMDDDGMDDDLDAFQEEDVEAM